MGELVSIVASASFVGLFVVALLRERTWRRDRLALQRELSLLRDANQHSHRAACRAQEDLYVLQSVMRDRHLIHDSELNAARSRLVEQPKRVAAERDAIQEHLNIGVATQVIEDSLNKVH